MRLVCMSPCIFPTALQLRAFSIPTGNQLRRGGLLGLQLGAAAPAALPQPMAPVVAVMPASPQQLQDANALRLQSLTAQLTYVQAEVERLRSAVGVTLAPEPDTVMSGCW